MINAISKTCNATDLIMNPSTLALVHGFQRGSYRFSPTYTRAESRPMFLDIQEAKKSTGSQKLQLK